MGVPKFYRWISERYPCLSEVVKENQIPEFDNLYLDMNGIIHPCSHPNDEDVHFRITEEQIFQAIFHYIEVLFRIIKPRKVFFMAVDGVAPRAKMNQQRGRRFRSAREAEHREKEAVAKGEVLPSAKRFDSNCITPGTPFMVRLNEQLKYFVHQKLTRDPMWQGLKVYLSGHETPGEGEHKIMDFIRSEKARADYDHNTRHCLYGLDADLIVLGLITHDPHFSLLREEVRFGKIANQKRPTTPEETTFHLLHLSLMREYLEIEFSALKSQVDWFDMERIIDDWVLMGFLVGNDFIPHLPDMHISHNALPLLYKAYIEVLPSVGGYLNENGTLNLPRFEKYITHLAKYDREKFEETFVDMSFFSGKTDIRSWKSDRVEVKREKEKERRAAKANFNQFAVLEELMGSSSVPGMKDVSKVNNAAFDLSSQDFSDEEDGDTFEEEFRAHKRAYYSDKFEIENITNEQLSVVVYDYVLGLQWILDYYFNGIQSWGWYFPYHYAPYMSDLKNFSGFQLKYEKGKPFLPFQQLLGVLPAASKELLPEPFQKLMTMDNSPIVDYYPLDFGTDLNGKLQEWEAVVLIPFIDEKRLLAAMEDVSKYLTAEEKSRNRHGPHLVHTFEETLNYMYPSSLPGQFPDINACRVRCDKLDKDIFRLDPSQLKHGLCKGAKTGVYFPGFPTLHHLKFTTKFSKDEVKVFQQNSRGENVILTIRTENEDVVAGDVANQLLGKMCFAEWPHLREVKVVAVADDQTRYELAESRAKTSQGDEDQVAVKKMDMSDYDAAVWVKDIKSIQDRYHKRKGVKIGPSYVLVYACPLMGRRYVSGQSGVVTLEKQWSLTPVAFAYQMVVKDIAVHDSTFKQFKTLEEVYPANSRCFMLGCPNYGSEGTVVEVEEGRVRVLFSLPVQPNLNYLKNSQSDYEVRYLPAHFIAQRVGLTSLIISRLSGTIFVGRGSRASSSVGSSNNFNIGLNLKFNKSNHEIQGYSKKDETGTWLYSSKVVDIIKEYMTKFPEVFKYIGQHARADNFFEDDLFNGKPGRMKELQDYIKGLPCANASKVTIGLKNLDEPVVKLIEAEVKKVEGLKVKKLKMCVRPHLLYKPLYNLGNLIPDPQAEHELFDRVVNVREGYTVPLGLRGVVIGIQPGDSVLDHVYEVIFDEEFPGGLNIRGTGTRGYRLPTTAIINISYGLRKEHGQQQSNKPTAVVKPQVFPQPNSQTQSRGWYADMVGKLGSSRQQQQRQPQVQAPAKTTPAINYKAALSQDNGGKPQEEQKSGVKQTPAMTILTRSGPKPVCRSPSKEQRQPRGSSPRGTPQRKPSREETEGRKSNPKTESRPESEKIKRKDSAPKSKTPSSAGRTEKSEKSHSSRDSTELQRSDQTRAQPRPQQTVAENEEFEFANMWRNLQKGSGSGTSSPITGIEESASSDSPSASGVQTPLSEEDMVQPSIQMQQALSALPKVAAPMSKVSEVETTTVEDGDEECEVEEFEADEEARMTPRTYAKSGTEELCRMLNISSVSGTSRDSGNVSLPHSVIIEASTGKKQYGIPLSLDQLFAGANVDNPTSGPSPVPLTPTKPVAAPMVSQGGTHPTSHRPYPQQLQPGAMPARSHADGTSMSGGPMPTSNVSTLPPYPHQSNAIPIPSSVHQVRMPVGPGMKGGSPGMVGGQWATVAGSPGMMVLQQHHPAPLGPGPPSGPQQGSSPSRFVVPVGYPPKSMGSSPGQQLPSGMFHGRPLIASSSGHQLIQPSRSGQQVSEPLQQQQQQHHLATAQQPLGVQQQQVSQHQQQQHHLATAQQPFGVQQQQVSQHQQQQHHLATAQQPFGVQQQQVSQQQPVRLLAHGHQAPTDVARQPAPVHMHPQQSSFPLRPQPMARQVVPNANQFQVAGPQGPGGFAVRQQQPFPVPQAPGQAQTASVPFSNTGPSISASPTRTYPIHPISLQKASPPRQQVVRPPGHYPGQMPRQPPPQGFQGQPQSASQALLLFCQHRGLPPPMYRFHKNNSTGQIKGTVVMGNGQQFHGKDCPAEIQAVEDAANVAMSHVTMQTQRGPMMHQMRPTTRPSLGQGPMIHTTGANPFVPLQVTKQLTSPARPSAETDPSLVGKPSPRTQMEHPNQAVPSYGHTSPRSAPVDLIDQSDGSIKPVTQRKLDFGSSNSSSVPADNPQAEMEHSTQAQHPSADVGSTGTVHSDGRVSAGAAASKRRRPSSKAKLAINFGAMDGAD